MEQSESLGGGSRQVRWAGSGGEGWDSALQEGKPDRWGCGARSRSDKKGWSSDLSREVMSLWRDAIFIICKFNILPPAKGGKFLHQELPVHNQAGCPKPRPA